MKKEKKQSNIPVFSRQVFFKKVDERKSQVKKRANVMENSKNSKKGGD